MQLGWLVKLRSVSYSLILHVIAAVLLVISFDFTTPIKPQHQNISIVNAVTVDKSQVDKELQRLKQEDEKQKQAEKQRLEDLEKKAEAEKQKTEDLKKQRLAEEKKLADTKKEKEAAQKQHEEEQKKVAELETQRKLEEEKKAQAETEKKHQEEEQKKKAAELKKQEEERQKAEDEKLLQEQLTEEETKQQADSDKKLVASLGSEINDKIASYFNLTGLPEGLSCKLRVNLLPDGEVVNASIQESSGNDIFDRRAVTAVQKASPLPVPKDADTFERLNLRDFTITFKP